MTAIELLHGFVNALNHRIEGAVGVVDDQIHTHQPGGLLGLEAGVAAGHDHMGIGTVPVQLADQAPGLPHGLAGDRAGVEHDDVCAGRLWQHPMAGEVELSTPLRQLCLVQPASERGEVDVLCHRACLSSGRGPG